MNLLTNAINIMELKSDSTFLDELRKNIDWATIVIEHDKFLFCGTPLKQSFISKAHMENVVSYDWKRKAVFVVSDKQEFIDHVVTVAKSCKTTKGGVFYYKIDPMQLKKQCKEMRDSEPCGANDTTKEFVPGVFLGMPVIIPDNTVVIDFGAKPTRDCSDRSDVIYHNFVPATIEITGPSHDEDKDRFFDPSVETWADLAHYDFLPIYQKSYSSAIQMLKESIRNSKPVVICGGVDDPNDIATNVAFEFMIDRFGCNIKDCRNRVFKALPGLNPTIRWTAFLCKALFGDQSCCYSSINPEWMQLHERINPIDVTAAAVSMISDYVTQFVRPKLTKPTLTIRGGKVIRQDT